MALKCSLLASRRTVCLSANAVFCEILSGDIKQADCCCIVIAKRDRIGERVLPVGM